MTENVMAPNSLGDDESRRDFLVIATGTVAAAGTALAVWPLIYSMNPSADVLAVSKADVDIGPIKVGQRITVVWRGKPVFIDHRPPERIELARADDSVQMIDPQLDSDRVQKAEWLIMVGVCTHLGCIPLGQKSGDPRGDFKGWFCPCHGSHYDTSGRIRKGPAPLNLVIPEYQFLDDARVQIG